MHIMRSLLLVAFCVRCAYAETNISAYSEILVSMNETVVLPCTCHNNYSVDWRKAEYDVWKFVVRMNNVIGSYRGRASLLVSDTHKNLSLQQVQLSDSGVYICYMETEQYMDKLNKIKLAVVDTSKVGHDVYTTVGDTANLTCGLDGVYEWWHVTGHWKRIPDHQQKSLIILNTRLSNSGMYVCRANTEFYIMHLYVFPVTTLEPTKQATTLNLTPVLSGGATNSILVAFIALGNVVVKFVVS